MSLLSEKALGIGSVTILLFYVSVVSLATREQAPDVFYCAAAFYSGLLFVLVFKPILLLGHFGGLGGI